MFKIFATPLVITIENGLVVSVRQNVAHKCCIVTDAASNARFLCEQVYLCSPDVIIEEHNGENIAWLFHQMLLLKNIAVRILHGY
jgi:hypothetical protein